MALRTVFMGTPSFAATILESLVEHHFAPALVISQPAKPQGRGQKTIPSPVELVAQQKNIPFYASASLNTPESLEVLKKVSPQVILVAAFGQILKTEILELPELFCLNVHASLLPKYRGAAPIQRAIWEGETETGITIQRIVKKLDAGDIYVQKKLPILAEDSSHTLFEKLALLGGEALLESLKKIERNDLSFVPQIESEATYARKIEKSDGRINWAHSAVAIFNQVRALNPWPVTEMNFQGEALKVFRVALTTELSDKPSGTLLSNNKDYLKVVAGDKRVLSLEIVQLPNRKRMPISEFLKGNPVSN